MSPRILIFATSATVANTKVSASIWSLSHHHWGYPRTVYSWSSSTNHHSHVPIITWPSQTIPEDSHCYSLLSSITHSSCYCRHLSSLAGRSVFGILLSNAKSGFSFGWPSLGIALVLTDRCDCLLSWSTYWLVVALAEAGQAINRAPHLVYSKTCKTWW